MSVCMFVCVHIYIYTYIKSLEQYMKHNKTNVLAIYLSHTPHDPLVRHPQKEQVVESSNFI